MLKPYAVFSFANFVDAKLSLAGAHFFLSFQLVVDALTFCQWPLSSRLQQKHST